MNGGLVLPAEIQAAQAGNLKAFNNVNLLGIRTDVELLLQTIGNAEIFDEYTKHDISHIDAMLESLEWIIPQETQRIMTAADWLILVLSIYFHDMGMVVTKDEYSLRDQSSFPSFKADVLQASDDQGRDYAARIQELSAKGEDIEKFLYQEFVRCHHAARVKNWILGNETVEFGASSGVAREVTRILQSLSLPFRKDLAFLCESHHLDDIDDIRKYPISKPYGTKADEAANVQYAAIILRTVDLLHITSDRTPSITFRLLNPSDPVSQREWAKQQAVTSVRAKKKLGPEGQFLPADSIEVHALFVEGTSYFGLISYLQYAESQIKRSFDWAQRSQREHGAKHEFPWRAVDTSNVQAEGFMTEQFEFGIDQAKILDLLTGHTLYNDTSVVLRELLQNAIDAVRVQHRELASVQGKVWITWNESRRVMEVGDNGSGMTQEIIENNLLRAGSSRYQDPQFTKENPDFHPISRFGIGVMSAFMIADQVDIITCHPEEKLARHLTLRSVHGKYLVRLLEKTSEIDPSIRSHGTIVKLSLRPSAKIADVFSTAKKWIVLPPCKVTYCADGETERAVGHANIGDALKALISERFGSSKNIFGEDGILVKVKEGDGFTIAFALRWNSYFKLWEFVESERLLRRTASGPVREDSVDDRLKPGICIEGIRVESNTPGLDTPDGIFALVNTSGVNSPRTNVARSELDDTPERSLMISQIYDAYCAQIAEAVRELQEKHGYSLSWASKEGQYLALSLTGRGRLSIPHLFYESLRRIPLLVVEKDAVRRAASLKEVDDLDELYTRVGNFSANVESLLRELPANASFNSIVQFLGNPTAAFGPEQTLLCGTSIPPGLLGALFRTRWEISEFEGKPSMRSCDVVWRKITDQPRWSSNGLVESAIENLAEYDSMSVLPDRRGWRAAVRLPLSGVQVSGFESIYIGASLADSIYLFPSHPWAWAVDEIRGNRGGTLSSSDPHLGILVLLINVVVQPTRSYSGMSDVRLPALLPAVRRIPNLSFNLDHFEEAVRNSTFELFDPRLWTRNLETAF